MPRVEKATTSFLQTTRLESFPTTRNGRRDDITITRRSIKLISELTDTIRHTRVNRLRRFDMPVEIKFAILIVIYILTRSKSRRQRCVDIDIIFPFPIRVRYLRTYLNICFDDLADLN